MPVVKKEAQKNRKPNHLFKEVITVMNELRKHVPQEADHCGSESVQNLHKPRHIKQT